jgi:hypothetical protein
MRGFRSVPHAPLILAYRPSPEIRHARRRLFPPRPFPPLTGVRLALITQHLIDRPDCEERPPRSSRRNRQTALLAANSDFSISGMASASSSISMWVRRSWLCAWYLDLLGWREVAVPRPILSCSLDSRARFYYRRRKDE